MLQVEKSIQPTVLSSSLCTVTTPGRSCATVGTCPGITPKSPVVAGSSTRSIWRGRGEAAAGGHRRHQGRALVHQTVSGKAARPSACSRRTAEAWGCSTRRCVRHRRRVATLCLRSPRPGRRLAPPRSSSAAAPSPPPRSSRAARRTRTAACRAARRRRRPRARRPWAGSWTGTRAGSACPGAAQTA